jgi:quercetin dioxygenase-like cupin family protein
LSEVATSAGGNADRDALMSSVPAMSGPLQVVWMPGGVRTEVHLGGEETAGAFCMLVDEPPAGWSLGAHRHRHEAETIHVVRGEFEIAIEGERSRLSAGQTIYVPQGAVHEGANVGADTGRRLIIFSPSGLERFFLETGASTAEAPVDLRKVATSAARHGWEALASGP